MARALRVRAVYIHDTGGKKAGAKPTLPVLTPTMRMHCVAPGFLSSKGRLASAIYVPRLIRMPSIGSS
jgi:hypothetical protein